VAVSERSPDEALAWLRAHPLHKQPLARASSPLATGFPALDDLLAGGLPRAAITEVVGHTSAGRTSLLLGILGATTRRGELVAWVDAEDALDPLSVEAAEPVIERFLWVRTSGREARKLALQSADLLVDAGGFAVVVLDLLGGREVSTSSPWVRLARRLSGTRTALVVLGRGVVTGSAAHLRLECRRRGSAVRVEVQKLRGGVPGGVVSLRLGEAVE
jgi:hypothetical protein